MEGSPCETKDGGSERESDVAACSSSSCCAALEKERLWSNDVTGKEEEEDDEDDEDGERNRSSHCPFHTTGGHSAKRVTIPEHHGYRNPRR